MKTAFCILNYGYKVLEFGSILRFCKCSALITLFLNLFSQNIISLNNVS
ncbi:hypothetical protein CLU96_2942 [Chryseobacterium sp. 52]|nr:hypothetical protein CLU96_2942 [Chryseobacterium sp. 52]